MTRGCSGFDALGFLPLRGFFFCSLVALLWTLALSGVAGGCPRGGSGSFSGAASCWPPAGRLFACSRWPRRCSARRHQPQQQLGAAPPALPCPVSPLPGDEGRMPTAPDTATGAASLLPCARARSASGSGVLWTRGLESHSISDLGFSDEGCSTRTILKSKSHEEGRAGSPRRQLCTPRRHTQKPAQITRMGRPDSRAPCL